MQDITQTDQTLHHIQTCLQEKSQQVDAWFTQKESELILPFYTSVDIRDSGDKIAVVDTNIYPAGFNNLAASQLNQHRDHVRESLLMANPDAKSILIIAEEHTRNRWYLENVYCLQQLITSAGFDVKVATFFDEAPIECETGPHLQLETATGKDLQVYCLRYFFEAAVKGQPMADLIVLNNDLSSGLPKVLLDLKTQVIPSPVLGWHSRRKSEHFTYANELIQELATLIGFDAWQLSLYFEKVDAIDITSPTDQETLAQVAEALFTKIQEKYDQHGIKEAPLVFVKADSGTYGMGVIAIESADDLRNLNRKNRNKLTKGKHAQEIHHFILQEGVPSHLEINHKTAELCYYQIRNKTIGGFFRLNTEKGGRDNLNSTGMSFRPMDPENGDLMPPLNHLYEILARLHTLAVGVELTKRID